MGKVSLASGPAHGAGTLRTGPIDRSSRLTHNPLALELEQKETELNALRKRRSRLASSLRWHSSFNRTAANENRARLADEGERVNNQLASTQADLAAAKKQTSELKHNTEAGWDPRYWFSKDRARAKERLQAHLQRLEGLETQQQALAGEHELSISDLDKTSRSIAKYDQFDQAAVEEELARVNGELSTRQLERDALAQRKERLDRQLKGPLENLHALRNDLEEATARRRSVESTSDQLERDIKKAEDLNWRLSAASDKHEKWEVHQECEDEFNEGRPSRVISDRRRKRSDARGELSSLDRRIPAIKRDVEKAQQRVDRIITRGVRDIRAIVIDGNNLCYQGSKFIGTAALRPLCRRLQEEYEVTLVFDASIRQLLSGRPAQDDRTGVGRLEQQFPNAKVHVVAASSQADETILAIAVDPVVYVLSNDRFSDYRDQAAVRDKRLITHEILGGQALIHDLGISVVYGAPR